MAALSNEDLTIGQTALQEAVAALSAQINTRASKTQYNQSILLLEQRVIELEGQVETILGMIQTMQTAYEND